jgi:hypothetical protein
VSTTAERRCECGGEFEVGLDPETAARLPPGRYRLKVRCACGAESYHIIETRKDGQ